MGPNRGCGLAAAHLWAGLWATSQVAPSPSSPTPALPSWDPWTQQTTLPARDHRWTPLPAPCCAHPARALQDGAGGEDAAPHCAASDTQSSELLLCLTGESHQSARLHVSGPAAQELLPRLRGQRPHAVPQQPCKGTGPVRAAFLPGSFLFLIPLTATKTCTLFSTSGFQQPLPDIKQGDFSPHKTTTKTPSNRVLPYSSIH